MATFNQLTDLLKSEKYIPKWKINRVGTGVTILDNSKIVENSMKLTESVCSGNVIKFGKLERNQLTFICDGAFTDTDFYVELELWLIGGNSAYDTISLGMFKLFSSDADANGLVHVTAYSNIFEDRETSVSFNGIKTAYSGIYLGLLYNDILSELGIEYDTSQLSAWSNTISTYNGIIETATDTQKYVDGEWRTYRVKKYQYQVSYTESGTAYKHIVKRTINTDAISALNYYLIDGSWEKMWYLKQSDDPLIPKKVYYGSVISSMEPVKFFNYGLIEVYDVTYSEGTEILTLIESINPGTMSVYRILNTSYTLPVFSGINTDVEVCGEKYINGTSGNYRDFTGNTYGEILESLLELFACIPYFNRSQTYKISQFSFSDGLYPNTNLYTSTTLYPSGAILLYDKSMQHLDSLDYKLSNKKYFKNITTPSYIWDSDAGAFVPYDRIANSDGIMNYSLEDNLILNTLNFVETDMNRTVIDNFVNAVKDIRFDSFNLTTVALPNVPIGTKIEIQGTNQITSYIMQRTLTMTDSDNLANNITGGI